MKSVLIFLRLIFDTIVKRYWNVLPRAKFWNGLALVTFVAACFAGPIYLFLFFTLGSIVQLIIIFVSGNLRTDFLTHHYWIFLMPSTWLLMCIYFVAVFVYDMKDEYIPRFNEWIDRICGK